MFNNEKNRYKNINFKIFISYLFKEKSSNLKLLLNILAISAHTVYDTRIQDNKVSKFQLKLHLISSNVPKQ